MIIKLNFEGEIPIYVQLRNEIVRGIGSGELAIGEKLPTVRSLANDTGINAMTVNKAYALLKTEGFVSIDRRHGAKVNPIYNGNIKFNEKLEQELWLITAEAAIRGYNKNDFLILCEKLFSSLQLKCEAE